MNSSKPILGNDGEPESNFEFFKLFVLGHALGIDPLPLFTSLFLMRFILNLTNLLP